MTLDSDLFCVTLWILYVDQHLSKSRLHGLNDKLSWSQHHVPSWLNTYREKQQDLLGKMVHRGG